MIKVIHAFLILFSEYGKACERTWITLVMMSYEIRSYDKFHGLRSHQVPMDSNY